jgi:hypothetical protein
MYQFSGVFFYTVSYRNPKLSMRFFWVKLHIKFTFHRHDPYGSGVTCPWIFYYRTYAGNSFLGFFSTPFHIGTWNFPWGSSELSYTSSSHFIVLTPMVSELCALGFITIGHMHVTVFRGIFYTVSHRNLKPFMRFFCVKLHIEFAFHHHDLCGSEVIFYCKTYAWNSFLSPKAGPLVMASITPASSYLLIGRQI